MDYTFELLPEDQNVKTVADSLVKNLDIFPDTGIITKPNYNQYGQVNAVSIKNEVHTVVRNRIILNQIPSSYYRVNIAGYQEIITNQTLKGNQFKVNYASGIIFFPPSEEGNEITITEYYGTGIEMIPASRIYLGTNEDGNITNTLYDMIKVGTNSIIALNKVGGVLKTGDALAERIETDISNANTINNTIENTTIPLFKASNTTLTNTINEANTENSTLSNTISQATTENITLTNTINSAKVENETLSNTIASATSENTTLVGTIQEGNSLNTSLENDISTGNSLHTTLQNDIESANATKESLTANTNTANSVNATLEATIVNATSENSTLEATVSKGNYINNNIIANIDIAKSNIATLKADNETAQQLHSDLTSDISTVNGIHSTITNDISSGNKVISGLSTATTTAKTALNSVDKLNALLDEKIGGNNLLIGKSYFDTPLSGGGYTSLAPLKTTTLLAGKEYVASAEIWCSKEAVANGKKAGFNVISSDYDIAETLYTSSTVPVVVSTVFTPDVDGVVSVYLQAYNNSSESVNGDIYIKWLNVQEGNKNTSWQGNGEELANQIQILGKNSVANQLKVSDQIQVLGKHNVTNQLSIGQNRENISQLTTQVSTLEKEIKAVNSNTNNNMLQNSYFGESGTTSDNTSGFCNVTVDLVEGTQYTIAVDGCINSEALSNNNCIWTQVSNPNDPNTVWVGGTQSLTPVVSQKTFTAGATGQYTISTEYSATTSGGDCTVYWYYLKQGSSISNNEIQAFIDKSKKAELSQELIGVKKTVSQNTSNISTNSNDISMLQTDIGTIQGNNTKTSNQLNALGSTVASNTLNINHNTTNIESLTQTVQGNSSSLSITSSNVNTNASNISANQSNIATNTTNIQNLTQTVKNNTSNISTNTANIATNTANIQNLRTQMEDRTNLIPNSDFRGDYANNGILSTAYGFASLYTAVPVIKGKTYSLSAYGYANGNIASKGGSLSVMLYDANWSGNGCTVSTNSSSPTLMTGTFTATETEYLFITSYLYPSSLSANPNGTAVCIEWYCLVEGDVPTQEWVPCNYDLEGGVNLFGGSNFGTSGSSTTSNGANWNTTEVELLAGVPYTFTANAIASPNSNGSGALCLVYNSNWSQCENLFFKQNDSPLYQSVTFVPNSTEKFSFGFYSRDFNGTNYGDNVTLYWYTLTMGSKPQSWRPSMGDIHGNTANEIQMLGVNTTELMLDNAKVQNQNKVLGQNTVELMISNSQLKAQNIGLSKEVAELKLQNSFLGRNTASLMLENNELKQQNMALGKQMVEIQLKLATIK